MMIDSNFSYSREIISLLDEGKLNCEIIICFSSGSLLDIASKIIPDLVLVDFDHFPGDLVNIVRKLRSQNPKSYIISIFSPDQTRILHQAVNDGLDDFLVKPLQREDLLLRINIGLEKRSREISLIDKALSMIEDFEAIDSAIIPENDTLVAEEEPEADLEFIGLDDYLKRKRLESEATNEDKILENILQNMDDRDIESVFEKEPEIPNSTKASVSKEELLSMTGKESSGGISSFEELFTSFDDSAEKLQNKPAEAKVKITKLGKVKYSPLAGSSSEGASSVLLKAGRASFDDHSAAVSKPSTDITKQKQAFNKKDKPSAAKLKHSNVNIFRFAGNVITAFLLIIVVGLSFFLIQSKLGGGTPAIAGYQMYVVLSGSMDPAFNTGSLIFVKPTDPSLIVEGDIITFRNSNDESRLITHRVVGINLDNGLSFITRGDANNANDPSPVLSENIVGRVTGSVPNIGYLVGYAQSRQGLILLIFVPVLLLIFVELKRLL